LKNYLFEINNIEDSKVVEACKNIATVEYFINYLLEADDMQKIIFYKRYKRTVNDIERRLRGNVD
jgi:hypothetical protein